MKKQISNEILEMYFKISVKDEYIMKHMDELIYCYENNKSLIDFDWWTHVEELIYKKISYQEYVLIDSQYDGDLMELEESDKQNILNILNNTKEDSKHIGYLKEEVKEPLILEPDDWSKEEWKTLCKLFNMNNKTCNRVVVKINELESFSTK